MATTVIKTNKDGGHVVLLFMTAPKPEGGVDVDIYLGDENYMATGKPSLGVDPRDEEAYHKELRKQATERHEFIPEFSTNPEWNPGYVEPEAQDFYPDAAI